VWFSEAATSKIGVLDPAKATPGTTDGMTEFPLQRNDFGRDPSPADVSIDRRGTLYWTDEYGDAVGSLTTAADQHLFRPAQRNSQTDSPASDSEGNLWFIEAGASMITRISGVTAGASRPDAPPTFTVHTATGVLSASGIHETDAVDLQVLRDGRVAGGQDGVALTQGTLSADIGARAGDTIRIVPRGASAPGAFSFTVVTLDATMSADGTVRGRATRNGTAVADRVSVVTPGGAGGDTAINPADGAFSAASVGRAGEIAWSEGTPAGIFRTVTPYGVPAADAQPGAQAPRTAAPGAPDPKAPGSDSAPNSCRDHLWLVRKGTSRRIPLLAASAKTVRDCLGRPTSMATRAGEQRWRYGTSLELRLRGGRVTRLVLKGASFASLPDRLAVGAPAAAIGQALGAQALAARRALLRLPDGRYADLRLSLRRSRVTRITVDLRAFGDLDAAGRRLAKGGG
jgi:hypothetical protein